MLEFVDFFFLISMLEFVDDNNIDAYFQDIIVFFSAETMILEL